uniref:Voltage-dependent calcium channel alpha-2/delta subunit conserved region domain-containing protein n=1 Tax=Hippocampus comes TaxID=109280 RepID=A0A3Q2XMG7_HIPCM
MCWVYSESSDSGHTLLDPYFAFLSAVKWLLTELVIFLVEFNLYSWWQSDLTAKAMQVPCDTEYPAFVSERTIKENTGNIDCDGCIKSFVIQQIPSSNLFMVVVDNKCDCTALTFPSHNESLKCERLKTQKDRRRPDTCHPFHPEENSMECGGAHTLTPSFSATLLFILLALFPR